MDAKSQVRSLQGFRTGILLTVSCWCVSAVAASGADIGCGSSERRLQSLTVSMDSLAARPVDHLSVGQKPASIAAEKSEAISKAAAPILHLAPHVAAMLNIVFENNDEPAVLEPEVEVKDESPTAGRVQRDPEIEEDVLPMNAIVPSDDIARFQRQMYRKDI